MKYIIILITLYFSSYSFADNWVIDNKIYKFDKVANKVFVIHGPLTEPNEINQGFMNNPALIVGNTGLIVVDPGGTYDSGKKLLVEIKKISILPIVAVFNTHVHGDHWLGNQAIVEKYPNVVIYAHPTMLLEAKNGEGESWVNFMEKATKGKSKGTKVVYPNATTKHLQKLIIAGEEFIIHNPIKLTHTNTDIMIEHRASKSLFMGDNNFLNRLGRFDDSSSILGNMQVLEYAKLLQLENYIPGHGKTGSFISSVQPFIDYLNIIKQEGQKAYDNDMQSYEIKDKVHQILKKYHSWSRYENSMGKHLVKIMTEIEEQDF